MGTVTTVRGRAGQGFGAVWFGVAVALAAIAYAAWFHLHQSVQSPTPLAIIANTSASVISAVAVVSGALIVSRQPRNAIGWLLMIPGAAVPFIDLATTWLVALDPPPSSVDPLLWLVLWFASWSWLLVIFPFLHLLLTFPDGALLSPRWRWAVWLEVTLILSVVVPTAFYEQFVVAQGGGPVLYSVANPIGFIPQSFDERLHALWDPAGFFLVVNSVTAVVLRYLRSGPAQRHQVKWLFYAMGVFASGMLLQGSIDSPELADLAFNVALGVIPIAVAVAVLRYRLYEIDRIVSRTVSYALVVAVLAGVFLGIISVLTSFLPAQSDLAVASSTLAVFVLFNPLRKRAQNLVDRRFNRTHYDSRRVVESFAETLRDRIDTGAVVDGWVRVVNETMQPASLGVWVSDRRKNGDATGLTPRVEIGANG